MSIKIQGKKQGLAKNTLLKNFEKKQEEGVLSKIGH